MGGSKDLPFFGFPLVFFLKERWTEYCAFIFLDDICYSVFGNMSFTLGLSLAEMLSDVEFFFVMFGMDFVYESAAFKNFRGFGRKLTPCATT